MFYGRHKRLIMEYSSMVEHSAVNRRVVGSSPTIPAKLRANVASSRRNNDESEKMCGES